MPTGRPVAGPGGFPATPVTGDLMSAVGPAREGQSHAEPSVSRGLTGSVVAVRR